MTDPKPFKAACVQLRSSDDVAENISETARLVREAAASGAQFIATPENTTLMAPDGGAKLAQSLTKPMTRRFRCSRESGKELNVWLLIGSPGDQGQRHQDRQPLFPVRARWPHHGALQQDPSVRCGASLWRDISRIQHGGGRRRSRGGRHRIWCDRARHLLRHALSTALSPDGAERRVPLHRALGLYRAHRQGALACAAEGPRHRERRLRDRAGAGRHTRQWPQDLWPQPDRRRPGAKSWRKPAPSQA